MFMPRNEQDLSLEAKVQLLMDERDIKNVIQRDCRAKSRNDVELLKTCFHDDAIDYHQPFFTMMVKDLYGMFESSGKALAEMVEYYTTQILVEVDGDVANVESHQMSCKVFHERTGEGTQTLRLSGMRFLDRLERRNGEWRIAVRRFIPEWGFFTETPPLKEPISIYGSGTEGDRVFSSMGVSDGEPETRLPFTRDRNDPSYAF